MAQYSIKDLEKLSGIQAHTIRIWEKRYRLVTPQRTDTNIRVYSDDDLKRLLNVAVLNHNGLKISKIARLNDVEIKDKIINLSSDLSDSAGQLDSLVVAMVELDESKFESNINNLIDQIGFEETFVKVVYPFLSKIGVLWQTGNINPSQEHFASNIIKRKLFVAIDQLSLNTSASAKFIFFLPEGEFHELGLLFYTYILKKNGLFPIYLGQSVPFEDLIAVQNAYDAEFMFTLLTTSLQDISYPEYLNKLSKTFKKQRIFVAGEQTVRLEIKRSSNITRVKSPDHLKEILKKLK